MNKNPIFLVQHKNSAPQDNWVQWIAGPEIRPLDEVKKLRKEAGSQPVKEWLKSQLIYRQNRD
jgi:hypothetical protein